MRLIALEAVREFGRRWATSHHLQPNALIAGGRLIDREARARDQLCFVIRGLSRASDELVGDALQLPARGVMVCRHRFADRIRSNPTLESYTSLLVRSVTQDELFLDRFCQSIADEDERRREIANRARADALTMSGQRPSFEVGRRAALDRYFAQGGSAALADRNRKRTDLKSTSVASAYPVSFTNQEHHMSNDPTSELKLPAGTYFLTAMLVGGDTMTGQTIRIQWPTPLSPEQLAMTAARNAELLVADEAAGAAEGTWWLFQALVFDAWGRAAMMARQVPIDRTLHRDELPGELGSVAPHAFTLVGEALARTLAPGSTDASCAPSTVRH